MDVHGDPTFTTNSGSTTANQQGGHDTNRSPQKKDGSKGKSRVPLRLPDSPQKKSNELAIASAARRAHAYTYVTAGSQRKAEKEAVALQQIAARKEKAARDRGGDGEAAREDAVSTTNGYTPLLTFKCMHNAADMAYSNGHMRIHRLLIGKVY
jgi:hypothetical protein